MWCSLRSSKELLLLRKQQTPFWDSSLFLILSRLSWFFLLRNRLQHSDECHLRRSLGLLAGCEAVRMRVRRQGTPKENGGSLPQVKEFNYLFVVCCLRVGNLEWELDRQISVTSAVIRALHTSVVKKELSRQAKLSIYKSIYVPTLTYGREVWVVTEGMRLGIQAAEISFLCKVAELSLRDRKRSSNIQRELGVEPLLIQVERSQLRFRHLIRLPPGLLPLQLLWACQTYRRPRCRRRTRLRDCTSHLAWVCLGVPQRELESVAEERDIWVIRLSLPSPRPGFR